MFSYYIIIIFIDNEHFDERHRVRRIILIIINKLHTLK